MSTGDTRLIYSSPNGDDWFLCRDDAGRAFVKHRANVSSGGHVTDSDIGDFLNRGPRNPEHEALLRVIGTLVGDHSSVAASAGSRSRGSAGRKTSAR
ncbi:MAG: hypothetical protein ACM30I_00440 [Gemmatimonas sp.]